MTESGGQMDKYRKKRLVLSILFILPALVWFICIVWYPMLMGIYYSFTDYDGLKRNFQIIGWENYSRLLSNRYIRGGIGTTLKFALLSTVVCNLLQLLLALVFDIKLRCDRFIRIAFYIPVLLSTVALSGIFKNIMQYRGVLNSLLRLAGMERLVLDWFSSSAGAFIMVAAINIWQWLGYGAIIYLAGLQTIPVELLDAARVDGAGPWKTFLKIKLPLLMPSITILTFLNLTGGLKLFDLPYTLTNGGPNDATETISMVIYRTAFTEQKMGLASAVAVVFFLMIAAVSVLQVISTRKKEVEL